MITYKKVALPFYWLALILTVFVLKEVFKGNSFFLAFNILPVVFAIVFLRKNDSVIALNTPWGIPCSILLMISFKMFDTAMVFFLDYFGVSLGFISKIALNIVLGGVFFVLVKRKQLVRI